MIPELGQFFEFCQFFLLTHLHRLGGVLGGPTGLDCERLTPYIPCTAWEDKAGSDTPSDGEVEGEVMGIDTIE